MTVTVCVPVTLTLLVSNIPDDIDNPDGLDDQWDIDGVEKTHDVCVGDIVGHLTDDDLVDIDERAKYARDLRESE